MINECCKTIFFEYEGQDIHYVKFKIFGKFDTELIIILKCFYKDYNFKEKAYKSNDDPYQLFFKVDNIKFDNDKIIFKLIR